MPSEQQESRRQELGRTLARFTWRRLFVRLFALATCLVSLSGIWATVYIYRQIDVAQSAAQTQLREISDTFNQVSSTLRTVSESSGHAATSVDDARTSLTDASAATRSAASALDQTAGTINFSIGGVRPLAGVDQTFREQAIQLRTLATSIDRTGNSIGQNSDDLRAISADLTVMAGQMNGVSQQVRQLAGYGPGPGALVQIANGTRFILTWSIVLHILLFGLGFSQFLLTLEPRTSRTA